MCVSMKRDNVEKPNKTEKHWETMEQGQEITSYVLMNFGLH